MTAQGGNLGPEGSSKEAGEGRAGGSAEGGRAAHVGAEAVLLLAEAWGAEEAVGR